MSGRPDIPGDLRAVAIIHLVMGVVAVTEVVVRLTPNHVVINFGVLGIPIFFGLLRLNRAWRTCALALLWSGLLMVPIACLVGLTGSRPVAFGVVGTSYGKVPREWLSVASAALFVLLLWQYRVLVRPGVRRLFRLDEEPVNTQHPTGAPKGARG